MAVNVYIMPAIGSGAGPGDAIRGKYWDQLAGLTRSEMRYGSEPLFLVVAQNVPPDVHLSIASNPDVVAVPDLGQTIGGQLSGVQARLAALSIPAHWLKSSHSYGSVVRVIAIFCQLLQRLGTQLFTSGVTLTTTWDQLPPTLQTGLVGVATAYGLDPAPLAGSVTLRQVLKAIADQWPAVGIAAAGTVL